MSSRRKGRHYENDFAARYGGQRISETGLPGPDVQTPCPCAGWHDYTTCPDSPTWEIKYRRQPIAALNWYDQATQEGANYLAIRRPYDTTYYIVHPVNQPCPCPLQETP